MSEDLPAAGKAAFDNIRLHVLARMDQIGEKLVEEFRQSTLRMECPHQPAEPAHHDHGENIDEHNRNGDQLTQEQDPSGQNDDDIANQV
jgi:hypothetical protein